MKRSVTKIGPVDSRHSPYARLRTLPVDSISLAGGFWLPKQTINRKATMPHIKEMLERFGWFDRLRFTAGLSAVAPAGQQGKIWSDSQALRWVEGMSHEVAKRPDSELEQIIDQTIHLIASAQQADGYFNTTDLARNPQDRFKNLGVSHELNVAGHLIQAGIAHHRATGSTRLLEIARRFADYADSVFGPGKRAGADGHPEVEMALIELYRDTGERRYLDLSSFFLDQRGRGVIDPGGRYDGSEYIQDHVRVREASTVVGHAVRQLYLNGGVADLYLETGEQALLDALMRQWDDMTMHKLFITGGVGSRYVGEAFGEAYELPNDRCYCETCAQIASIMWNWRMLLATGEGRFADLIERTLYNGFLSGISPDGRRFFYVNPLLTRGTPFLNASPGAAERQEWFHCPCCPTNAVRLLASLDHYFATCDGSGLQIHLYDSMRIDATLPAGQHVSLAMETSYPWDGKVRLVIGATDGSEWRLSLRHPGWCEKMAVRINGQPASGLRGQTGYVTLQRRWVAGDVVELEMPMAPRLIEANPLIDTTRQAVAIERGPIVYCLEQADQQPSVNVLTVQIDETRPLEAYWDANLLGGTVAIKAAGYALDMAPWKGKLYRPLASAAPGRRLPVELVAIPYYLWANRGLNAMRVWIPRGGNLLQP